MIKIALDHLRKCRVSTGIAKVQNCQQGIQSQSDCADEYELVYVSRRNQKSKTIFVISYHRLVAKKDLQTKVQGTGISSA
jgi:hypothetical protein